MSVIVIGPSSSIFEKNKRVERNVYICIVAACHTAIVFAARLARLLTIPTATEGKNKGLQASVAVGFHLAVIVLEEQSCALNPLVEGVRVDFICERAALCMRV